MNLLGWLLRDPWRIKLGEPVYIDSDVAIRFKGNGPVRFRIQHAGGGRRLPDELSWCDVSAMNNGSLAQDAALDGKDMSVRGILIDRVDGDLTVKYRRHNAHWLRIVADYDEETERCSRYSISIKPTRCS